MWSLVNVDWVSYLIWHRIPEKQDHLEEKDRKMIIKQDHHLYGKGLRSYGAVASCLDSQAIDSQSSGPRFKTTGGRSNECQELLGTKWQKVNFLLVVTP